nr:alpha/beta hydrolase [Sphingomonas sp. Y57]
MPPLDPAPPVRTRRWIAGDGIEIVGDVGGDPAAPAVVLMHGGGQTRYSWAGAVGALIAAGYHVVNFDAAGHGESGWAADGIYNLERRIEHLHTVTAGLGGPIALVGASLGGATAMRALASGDRPAALALVDIVPKPDRGGVQRIRDFMQSAPDGFGSLDDVADAVASYNPHRPRPTTNSGLMRNLRQREDGRWHWHWDPSILTADVDESLAEFEETIAGLATAQEVPILLVRGLESDVVNDRGIADLRAVLPALEIYDVAGAGHMVAGDRNDAFNQGIIEFLHRRMPAR